MKERYLWIGVIVILLSWGGNYFYFQTQQLENPIFLNHYYQMYHNEEANEIPLTFYYLTDKKEPLDVNYVEMNGIQAYPTYNHDGFTMFNDSQPQIQYEQEFNHQYLMSTTISIRTDTESIFNTDNSWSFSNMEVFFTNGEHVTANIGEVVVQPYHGQSLLETRASGSSNQHRSVTSMVATEQLSINEISLPFKELEGDVSVKVGLDEGPGVNRGLEVPWEDLQAESLQKTMFPFDLTKNNQLRLYTYFNPESMDYYQFEIEIKGTTEDGESFTSGTMINNQPHLEEADINKIIELKQGRE
ncbi:hypothetical protein [Aquibacillus rhizosphaerae]|uniref:DUF5643 domain-containing protein n=1 Tax=Aquibacillus rhizosphaerae TaxID=3051431 RepID=A0ABT7L5N0_9BACI|nr:hypothetical protein [Aquibacillus sp. LR5S19]MDL4841178.1 hypothetical protein [Aquibacillus sp. LR5S19]